MVKQEILDSYFPMYSTMNRILNEYSEDELSLLEEYPDDIYNLEEEIIKEVQWDILKDVISEYIDVTFYHKFENELMEYFLEVPNFFISRHGDCKAYCLHSKLIVTHLEYFSNEVNEKVNINGCIEKLVNRLNSNYPIKFIYD